MSPPIWSIIDVSPQNEVIAKYWIRTPVSRSIVCTSSGGPPMPIAALILFVP